MRSIHLFHASVLFMALVTACGDDDGSGTGGAGATTGTSTGGSGGGTGGSGGGPVIDTLRVSGTVVDFQTGTDIVGSATVTTQGLTPLPTISVTGASFDITDVPPFSVFHLLSGAPPDYRSTYGIATEVTDMDLTDVKAQVVSEGFITDMANAFNIMPQAGTSIVIALAVNEAGAPAAGVPSTAFAINDAMPPVTPRFLDGMKAPAPGLNATSESGYVVFFNVPIGLVTVGASMNSGLTIVSASAPAAATAVTLARAVVTTGGPVLPTNVSFATDIVPIFAMRGCEVCHSGNSIGADKGDLTLNGGDNKIYTELTQEISPKHMKTRVDLMNPEQSLILTMPSADAMPDGHPNVTFVSNADEDYLKLLVWIQEGAKLN